MDEPEVDFIHSYGSLIFRHGEAVKTIIVPVNPKSAVGEGGAVGSRGGGVVMTKNFIIALKNPSVGAKIGSNSAAVAHLATRVRLTPTDTH